MPREGGQFLRKKKRKREGKRKEKRRCITNKTRRYECREEVKQDNKKNYPKKKKIAQKNPGRDVGKIQRGLGEK